MTVPGWLLPVMRMCPVCKRQCLHPRGDGCEKCTGEATSSESSR